MRDSYAFGVEIEIIAEPHKVRHPLQRFVYYEKLATSLRWHGLEAMADDLSDTYRKHREHYDKWWITKDGSLGRPEHPRIPLEAVSPILNTSVTWEDQIDIFWKAYKRVFHMPIKSPLCGSHIHISPGEDVNFRWTELRNIAFGVFYYENKVISLLPYYRELNKYCLPNTHRSNGLRNRDASNSDDLEFVWIKVFCEIENETELRNFMQQSRKPKDDRRVLWNFNNILPSRTGTIEFRGGRELRGEARTKRWISFVVSFIHLCLYKRFHQWDEDEGFNSFPESMDDFWEKILESAATKAVKQHLPSDWRAMQEPNTKNLYESGSWSFLFDDSSDSSDTKSVSSKARSVYSDSDCSSTGREYMIREMEREKARSCTIL